jgi:tRNA nucleotidyltransferase (CCA-adding enzyme)
VRRPEAFDEDPLRMLRACQFAARFEYSVTPATMAAMRGAAPLAPTISAERVRDELIKLLELAPRPSTGFELMREGGLLELLLPEIAEGIGVEQNEFHAYDVYRHSLATLDATPPGDLVLRLAALLHDVAKPRTKDGPHFYRHEIVGEELAREILPRLRFSSDVVQTVAALVRHHMYAADPALAAATIRRFVRRVGVENLNRQFALRSADVIGSGLPKRGANNEQFERRVAEIVAERPAFSVRDLALGGEEVIAEAIRAGKLPPGSRGGPLIGELLQRLLEQVTDDPARNEPAQLLAAVREMLSEPLPDERI